MWKKAFVCFLAIQTPALATWSIDTYPAGVNPNSTLGVSGTAEPNGNYAVEMRFGTSEANSSFLCSHSGSTGYMGMNWDEDFAPEDAPNDAWPLDETQPFGPKKTLVAVLKVGTTVKDEKTISCTAT